MAEKTDLNWPFKLKPVNITSNAKLLFQMIGGAMKALPKGDIASAASDFVYPEQAKRRARSPLKYPLAGGTITPEPSRAAGRDREPASEGDLFSRGLLDLNDEVMPAAEAPQVDELPPARRPHPPTWRSTACALAWDAGKAR